MSPRFTYDPVHGGGVKLLGQVQRACAAGVVPQLGIWGSGLGDANGSGTGLAYAKWITTARGNATLIMCVHSVQALSNEYHELKEGGDETQVGYT
jgi:hypothetical protein